MTAGCDNHTLSRITVNKFETDPSLTFFNQNCRPSQSAVTPKCRMDNVKICKTKHLSCLASPKDVGQIREAPKISNIYLGVMFLACIENNVHKKEGKCGNNQVVVKGRLGIKLTAVGLIFGQIQWVRPKNNSPAPHQVAILISAAQTTGSQP